jgi:hypothetical protein
MKDFIEQGIGEAVRGLLSEQVNELLSSSQVIFPLVEFGLFNSMFIVTPAIVLTHCEQTEKERIIRQDAYLLTITLTMPDTPDGELHCYAYSGAIGRALYENPTLGGIVDRAVITGKKYVPPIKEHCGESWSLVVSLRITVEAMKE